MEVKGKSISEEEEEQITQSLSPPSIKQNTPLQIYNMNYLPQVEWRPQEFLVLKKSIISREHSQHAACC